MRSKGRAIMLYKSSFGYGVGKVPITILVLSVLEGCTEANAEDGNGRPLLWLNQRESVLVPAQLTSARHHSVRSALAPILVETTITLIVVSIVMNLVFDSLVNRGVDSSRAFWSVLESAHSRVVSSQLDEFRMRSKTLSTSRARAICIRAMIDGITWPCSARERYVRWMPVREASVGWVISRRDLNLRISPPTYFRIATAH
jgi:hypothetical protein